MKILNIKQLSDADIDSSLSVIQKTFDHATGLITKDYVVFPASYFGASASKLGYNCEPKGIGYPIYLTISGVEKQFYVGKTGMYEIQPEPFNDINDDNPQEKIAEVYITEVKVPKGIRFKLDYITAVI